MQWTDSIHDICVVNTDAVSYQSKTPEKCLDTAERKKKKKYLHACFNKRWHFNPLVASVEILLGVETEVTLEHIACRLAKKWKETYSRTCRYLKSRAAITIVRATHSCIRGGRVKASQISGNHPQWGDGAVLPLYQ